MNYRKRVLQFNLLFLISLIIISLAYPKVAAFWPKSLRAPDIFSEIRQGSRENHEHGKEYRNTGNKARGKLILKDYLSDSGLVNAAGNSYAVNSFLQKLAALKNDKTKKVRIAWLGDSFIEGDLITKDIREKLQTEFGGSGVGFVPVTSVTAGFRQTITQTFSKDWSETNFKSDNRKEINLFLSGHSFLSEGANSVSFRSVKSEHLDSFTHMQVLFGRAESNASLQLSINGSIKDLLAKDLFNAADVMVNSRVVNVSSAASDIPLYGFSFEGEAGVVLDNFSFRGISGTEFGSLNDSFLAAVNRNHPYDLVVLQYGPNLLYKAGTVDFSWYQKKMLPVLKKLRADFPGAEFLLVSTADKAFSYDGEWQTQKGVEPLIDAQYDMADATKMDFFNLYHAMGGEGQMVKWVNAKPALADKDYTHVNSRGATAIAELIYKAIIREYDFYQKDQ